ncbi:MAG: energy transducer TonB [Erythrobacter sp.]|nr:energy transducer TonB [Erythrobacter sp.]
MKTIMGVTNLIAFLIAAHVPAATLAQDGKLPDQPRSQQAPTEAIQTPPAPPSPIEVRAETPAEAAARSKAQAERARATETASKARSAVPKNVRQWTGRILDAYPLEAKREGWEGTVGLSVTVSADGRVSRCKVTVSSGYAILDNAACEGMARYARFEPALDCNGLPTSGTFSTRITFAI